MPQNSSEQFHSHSRHFIKQDACQSLGTYFPECCKFNPHSGRVYTQLRIFTVLEENCFST